MENCTSILQYLPSMESQSVEPGSLLFEDGPDLVEDELIAVAKLATFPHREEFARLVSVYCLFVFLYYVLHNNTILSQMSCFVNTIQ